MLHHNFLLAYNQDHSSHSKLWRDPLSLCKSIERKKEDEKKKENAGERGTTAEKIITHQDMASSIETKRDDDECILDRDLDELYRGRQIQWLGYNGAILQLTFIGTCAFIT